MYLAQESIFCIHTISQRRQYENSTDVYAPTNDTKEMKSNCSIYNQLEDIADKLPGNGSFIRVGEINDNGERFTNFWILGRKE